MLGGGHNTSQQMPLLLCAMRFAAAGGSSSAACSMATRFCEKTRGVLIRGRGRGHFYAGLIQFVPTCVEEIGILVHF